MAKGKRPENAEKTEFNRERAVQAGIKSGEARRARKTLKEELLLILSDGNTQKSVATALVKKAKQGDVKAFKAIRDTIGEKPVEKVEAKSTVIDLNGYSTEELKKVLEDDIS